MWFPWCRRLYDSTDLLSPVFDTSVTRDTAVRREVGGERGVAVSLYVEAVTHDGVRDVLTRTSTLAAVQVYICIVCVCAHVTDVSPLRSASMTTQSSGAGD